MKYLYIIMFLFCVIAKVNSQSINILWFDASLTYGPGSGTTIVLNPTDTFTVANKFIVELSDAGGTWSNPTTLSEIAEFYTPVINAILPTNLSPGRYKIRIKSTSPEWVEETPSFDVKSGETPGLPLLHSTLINNSNYFNCLSCSDTTNTLGSLNQQAGSTTAVLNAAQRTLSICNYNPDEEYQITLFDVLNNNQSTLTQINGSFQLPDNLKLGTYVIQISTKKLNSSVWGTTFLFHGNGTNLGNSSSEEICVNNSVLFGIDTSVTGIGRNYKGSKYVVNFGDGSTPAAYTQTQLMSNPIISHIFSKASCSESSSSFLVQIQLQNKGILNSCSTYVKNGNGVSKAINVSVPPSAEFKAPLKSCINKQIYFENTTIPGFYGKVGCKDASNFYWYYKKPGTTEFTLVTNQSWIDTKDNLTIPASFIDTPGCWEIKIEAQNQDLCQIISSIVKTVKIEPVSSAIFEASKDSVCAGSSVLFTNKSDILNLTCSEPTYKWSIETTVQNGYVFSPGYSASTTNMSLMFLKPGKFSIKLQITNSCGITTSAAKDIYVAGNPTVKLPEDSISACLNENDKYVIDFSETQNKPVYGSNFGKITSYSWEVSGNNISANHYKYLNGTNASSAYPAIEFDSIKNYNVKVTIKGSCFESQTATLNLNLNKIPDLKLTETTQTICNATYFNDIVLNPNSSISNYSWTVQKTPNLFSDIKNGNGNTINGCQVTNNSDSIGTISIKIRPVSGICIGNEINYLIYVLPSPGVNKIQDMIVCNESTVEVKFNFNTKSLSQNINWWTNNTNIGIPTHGNDNINFTAINSGLSPLTSTIYYTSTVTKNEKTCESKTDSVKITVLPTPQINPIQNITVCSGQRIDKIEFFTKNTGVTTTFSWKNSNPEIGLKSQSVGNIESFIAKNATNKPIIATITVQAELNSSNCNSQPLTFTITVNPTAHAHLEGEKELCKGSTEAKVHIICSNGEAPYTVIYSLNNGAKKSASSVRGNDTINIDVPTIITGNLLYKIHSVIDSKINTCENSNTDSLTIIIADNPMIDTQPIPEQVVCKFADADTLKVIMSGGAGNPNFQWYSNNTAQNYGGKPISGATSLTYVPKAFAETGDYYFYCVVTSNASNCGSATSDIAHITVIDLPKINTQPLASQEVCLNRIPSKLKVEIEGNSSDFSFQWYKSTKLNLSDAIRLTGATNSEYLPATDKSGILYYYCEITKTGKGCSISSSTAVVNTLTNPTISVQPISQMACQNDLSGKLSVSYTGGSSFATYQWFSNTKKDYQGSTPIPNANLNEYKFQTTEAGIYYYYCQIYIGKDSCSVLQSTIAAVNIQQNPVISNKTVEIISGKRFTLIPSNNLPDIIPTGTIYSWKQPVVSADSPISGMTAQINGQPTISDLLINNSDTISNVVYTITPEINGCTGNEFYLNVIVLPSLSVKVKKQDISCYDEHNGQLEATITGGVRFKNGSPYIINWTGPNAFKSSNLRISNLDKGEYTISVKDSAGAEFTNKYIIEQPEKLTITTDKVVKTSCSGENSASISVDVNGGKGNYSYKWLKNNNFYSDTEDIKNLNEGNYVLIVTDENNCSAVSEVYEIKNFEPIVIEVVEQIHDLCYNATSGSIKINVTGGTRFENSEFVTPYKFSWSGPDFSSTEKDIAGLAAGKYELIVTDKNGCTALQTINITQPDELKVTPYTTPVSCFGKNDATITLNVEGGKPPYTAEWNNYATGLYQENLSPGEYAIKITDANKCEKNLVVKIEEETQFTVTSTINQVSCFGAKDGSIHLSIKSNRTTMKIKWADGSTAGTDRNNLSPGIYVAQVSDGGPCVLTNTFIITEPAQLVVTANIKNAFGCEASNSGSISVKVSGGSAPYKYLWSNGSIDSIATNLYPGKHFVTVTDKNNCSVTEAFDLIRHEALQVNISSKIAFSDTNNKFKEVCTAEVSGGLAPYNYSWSGGSVSATNPSIMETFINQTIELTVTDALGCTSTAYIKTNIPQNNIGVQMLDCNNQVYKFDIETPPGSFTNLVYNWDFGDGSTSTIKSPTHIFLKSGEYLVNLKITSNEGELQFATNMSVEALPTLKLDREPKFCKNDSVELIVSGAESYIWNDGTKGNRKVIKREGNYSVLGTSANGCSTTLNFTAQYYANQNYTIQTDKNVLTLNDPTLKVWSENINYTSYSWNFGDNSTLDGNFADHTYDIDSPVTVKVKLNVINPWGCEESAEKTVWLIMESIPNTFTPNNDGINDTFLKGTKLQVFNANGIILYEGTEGWDGTYKGKKVAMDTYYYVVYYSTPEGIVNKPGFVFLAN